MSGVGTLKGREARNAQEGTMTAKTATATARIVRFYSERSNGTLRHIPTLSGDERKLAEAIVAQRAAGGVTMKQISAQRNVSVATVRRLLVSLEVTLAHEAGQFDATLAASPEADYVVFHAVVKA